MVQNIFQGTKPAEQLPQMTKNTTLKTFYKNKENKYFCFQSLTFPHLDHLNLHIPQVLDK